MNSRVSEVPVPKDKVESDQGRESDVDLWTHVHTIIDTPGQPPT